jgi:hypothetical protein
LRAAALSGAVTTTALTGCLGQDSEGDSSDHGDDGHDHGDDGHSHGDDGGKTDEQSFEPPAAVYKPRHMDEMSMIGKPAADGVTFGTMHAAPHPFLNVQANETRTVAVTDDHTMHFMVKPWSTEETVVPASASLSVTLQKDGEFVAEPNMWPMLSQPMGFHFGENVTLDGPGTYTAEIVLVPPASATTGTMADVFGDRIETTVEFDVTEDDLDYGRMEVEGGGKEGALKPKMGKKGQLPVGDELSGSFVGEKRSDGVVFAVTALEDVSRFDAGGKTYLAVSPRTPYNRYPFSNMSLSATIERSGETVFDDALGETLDETLELHHGAVLDDLQSGDTITLSVDGGRPNVSRHTGYETALLDIQDVDVSVE